MPGTCDPSPTQTPKRDDFTGFVGLAFVTQPTSAGLFQELASNAESNGNTRAVLKASSCQGTKGGKFAQFLMSCFEPWSCKQWHPETHPKIFTNSTTNNAPTTLQLPGTKNPFASDCIGTYGASWWSVSGSCPQGGAAGTGAGLSVSKIRMIYTYLYWVVVSQICS